MPLYKKIDHMNEVLDTAVSHRIQLRNMRRQVISRRPSEWIGTHISPQENIEGVDKGEGYQSSTGTFEIKPSFIGSYFLHISSTMAAVSRFSELILASKAYTVIRLIVAPIAFFNVAYLAPRSDLSDSSDVDFVVYYLDLIVNSVYILQAIFQLLGTSIRFQFDVYRHHNTTNVEIIGQSGILALPVTISCFIIGSESESGVWLRFVRLVFITNTIFDFIPQTHILMSGVISGLRSTFWSFLLLFNLICMYAALGFFLFKENDPFNFGSYSLALLAWFRVATFDNWSNLYNLNLDGCDGADGDYSGSAGTYNNTLVQTVFGKFYPPLCNNPQPQPEAAGILFWSFIIFGSFVLLSVSLAAVAIGIMSRLDELHNSKVIEDLTKEKSLEMCVIDDVEEEEARMDRLKDLIRFLWTGRWRRRRVDDVLIEDSEEERGFLRASRFMQSVVSLFSVRMFILAVTLTGVVCEILVDSHYEEVKKIKIAVQVILTIDLVLRACLHTPSLMHFFKSSWRIADATTIILLWLPIFSISHDMKILDFLYFFRLFLATIHFYYMEELASVTIAIVESSKPFGYVAFLMLMSFYFFGVSGVILFKDADPYHWSSIGSACNTLLQLLTLDGWYMVARVGMIGCSQYGYFTAFKKYDELCDTNLGKGIGLGWYVAIHYICFIILSTYILLSLLVGMILSSLELLRQEILEKNRALKKAEPVIDVHDLTDDEVLVIIEMFNLLDLGENGSLGFSDMQKMFELIELQEHQKFPFFRSKDKDGNGKLDFAEFCDFVGAIKSSITPGWLNAASAIETEKPFGWSGDDFENQSRGSSDHSVAISAKGEKIVMISKQMLDRSPIILPKYMELREEDKDAEMNFSEDEVYLHVIADEAYFRPQSQGRRRASV